MSTKTVTKKPTKRIIVDYTQNLDLEYILSQLENVYFSGLSKAEITKLAIIQLFKIESKGFVPSLTAGEEESLAKAMEDQGGFVSIPQGQSFSQFVMAKDF